MPRLLFLIFMLSGRAGQTVIEEAVFDRAFQRVAMLEGHWSDHPQDKGGKTKFGISSTSHPGVDLDSLTLEQARQIYYDNYWSRFGIYRLASKPDVAIKVMDMAVNMGGRKAIMILQRALRSCGHKNVADDGVLGDETTRAFEMADEACLLVGLRSESAGYYRGIVGMAPNQAIFLKGWLNRAYS